MQSNSYIPNLVKYSINNKSILENPEYYQNLKDYQQTKDNERFCFLNTKINLIEKAKFEKLFSM